MKCVTTYRSQNSSQYQSIYLWVGTNDLRVASALWSYLITFGLTLKYKPLCENPSKNSLLIPQISYFHPFPFHPVLQIDFKFYSSRALTKFRLRLSSTKGKKVSCNRK